MDKKPVPGYEDNYYLDPDTLQVVNKKTGHPLKPQVDRYGYPEVQLWKDNHGTHKQLHRLFAEGYVSNPDGLPEVNHKDENPMNYSLDNLEWCTHSYNQNYGTANARRGSKISAALRGVPKPWVAEQKSIPIIAADPWGNETRFTSARDASRQLGIDASTITAVIRGRRRSTGGYRFFYAEP